MRCRLTAGEKEIAHRFWAMCRRHKISEIVLMEVRSSRGKWVRCSLEVVTEDRNDYHQGLAHHPTVVGAIEEALKR